jgi:hypothetical protein
MNLIVYYISWKCLPLHRHPPLFLLEVHLYSCSHIFLVIVIFYLTLLYDYNTFGKTFTLLFLPGVSQ